jgi:hypothetical protein
MPTQTKVVASRLSAKQYAALAAEGLPSAVIKRIVESYTGIKSEPKGKAGRPKKAKPCEQST